MRNTDLCSTPAVASRILVAVPKIFEVGMVEMEDQRAGMGIVEIGTLSFCLLRE